MKPFFQELYLGSFLFLIISVCGLFLEQFVSDRLTGSTQLGCDAFLSLLVLYMVTRPTTDLLFPHITIKLTIEVKTISETKYVFVYYM